MKKLFCVFFAIILVSCLFAETYNIKSGEINLDITVNSDKKTYISSVKDIKTGQEFIKNSENICSLWSFSVKKNKDFAGQEYRLSSDNCKKITASKTPDSLSVTYWGVTLPDIEETFKVICTVKAVNNNSYWDISIESENGKNQYGVWEVEYPCINNIYAENGDEFFIPSKGDVFIREFDNPKGFQNPDTDKTDEYVKTYSYPYPKRLQYSSLTKGKTTLYMSTEDNTATSKTMYWETDAPNFMKVKTVYQPQFMGVAGHKYVQKNHYNIAVMKGDWFIAAKKYRKWGISANYAPFSKGKIENRKDLPNWWKHLTLAACVSMTGSDQLVESVLKAKEVFNEPVLTHLYAWSDYPFDTHYPNWLPIREIAKKKIDIFRAAGCYIMPYTNGHLADLSLSPSVKAHNGSVVRMKPNGKYYSEPYAVEYGSDNNVACIGSDYSKLLSDEINNIFRTYSFDALYIDQVSCSTLGPCFDETHTHPVGGGNFSQTEYNKLLNNIKSNLKDITGKDIPIISEDGADIFQLDCWLKCNEALFKSENVKVRNTVFSGYVFNMGDTITTEEYKDTTGLSIINRMASVFTKGYILGWENIWKPEFWKNENAVTYAKGCVEARKLFKDYFNFGEMVRDVNIKSNNPKVNITWYHSSSGVKKVDAPTIKTISLNYKGKTLVVITNANTEPCPVEWTSDSNSLFLKQKKVYNINMVYPQKKAVKKSAKIGDTFTISPLETICYIID